MRRRFQAAESRIAIWLLACPIVFAAQARDAFNLSEPKSGVFVHIGRQLARDAPGHDDIANIGFIVGRKCAAVIDTGGSVNVGRELRAAVETVPSRREAQNAVDWYESIVADSFGT